MTERQPVSAEVSAEVQVAVSPQTAFCAFTEEMNLWWVRGPINFYDSGRAVGMRCEAGPGGRILEVYDDATGDALELGRITVWQPGSHLAWQSSVDDVHVDIYFEPAPEGATVRVEARIPPGGVDRGGTAWVRVTPAWFGRWCGKRDTAPREPRRPGRLAVAVYYVKPATAARWLAQVFRFDTPGPLPQEDAVQSWIEFHIGDSSLMLFKLEDARADHAATTHVPWVFVDDLDAHFAHVKANGATIVEGIQKHGYRAYVAADLEGHRWTFAQAPPTMQ